MDQIKKTSGLEYTWDKCKFTSPDSSKLFDKWLCSADNKYYYPGEKYTYNFGRDITLTAVWKSKKINSIYVEIDGFENAVHGHNVEEFRNMTADDRHISASNVKWTMFKKELSNTEIYLNENFEICFDIDTQDGYELADTVNCYVGNVKGGTVSAVRMTETDTSTHTRFYFTYQVPAPEGGIYIDTVNRTLDETTDGITPDALYSTMAIARTVKYSNTVAWTSTDKGYIAEITLTPYTNYRFDENTSVTINDKLLTPTYNANGTLTVRLPFTDKGDIDLNGTVNKTDAAVYLKHLTGKQEFTEEQYKRADMNNDGRYDMLDVIAILNKAS